MCVADGSRSIVDCCLNISADGGEACAHRSPPPLRRTRKPSIVNPEPRPCPYYPKGQSHD